jgi:hypothetical protein
MRAVKSVVAYPIGQAVRRFDSYARFFYPSRSNMCKDHLPLVSLQLQVSQVDRAYRSSVDIAKSALQPRTKPAVPHPPRV